MGLRDFERSDSKRSLELFQSDYYSLSNILCLEDYKVISNKGLRPNKESYRPLLQDNRLEHWGLCLSIYQKS